MKIEINKKNIKLSKDDVTVQMDFIDDIEDSKLDWYIDDLTQQLNSELELKGYHSNMSITRELPYNINRQRNYPPIEEQLDMLYWDRVNGTNNWQDKITEIKTKYPKPT